MRGRGESFAFFWLSLLSHAQQGGGQVFSGIFRGCIPRVAYMTESKQTFILELYVVWWGCCWSSPTALAAPHRETSHPFLHSFKHLQPFGTLKHELYSWASLVWMNSLLLVHWRELVTMVSFWQHIGRKQVHQLCRTVDRRIPAFLSSQIIAVLSALHFGEFGYIGMTANSVSLR